MIKRKEMDGNALMSKESSMSVFQDAGVGIGVVEALGWGLIFATLRETISESEGEEVAKVGGAGGELLMHITIEDKGATA